MEEAAMGKLALVSTDGVADGELNDAWKKFLSTYVARDPDDLAVSGITFEPQDAHQFKGCIEYGDLGDTGICRVVSASHRYIRNPRQVFDTEAPTMVVLQTRGTSLFHQDGRKNCLSPGDWSIYDTSRPFSIASAGQSEHLVFLHRHGSARNLRDALERMPERSFGRNGIERTARDLISSAFRECQKMSYRAGVVTSESILQIIHAAVEEAAEMQGASAPTLKSQIIDFIDINLADDELTVSSIASAFGYSTRQIHRMFQDETGMTVSEYIWKSRLEHSLEDLRNVANEGRTITDIAFNWGFSNAAHFSRVFKEAYGITPRECRHLQVR
jgi:AraC family transcriptional activator of tynA and feaB